MSDSVPPHRRQPSRLPRPWDSPGKNTGVGCHFLLQCIKVKSESEVAQSCPTLSDPMDCSPPGSSVHGIFQARVLEWGAIAFSKKDLTPWQITLSWIWRKLAQFIKSMRKTGILFWKPLQSSGLPRPFGACGINTPKKGIHFLITQERCKKKITVQWQTSWKHRK